MIKKTPSKTIAFSAYYDAASTTHNRDFGIHGLGNEDRFFSESVRQLVLSRFRREVRSNPFLAGLYSKLPEAMGTSRLRSTTSDKEYNQGKEKFWKRWTKKVSRAGDSLGDVENLI